MIMFGGMNVLVVGEPQEVTERHAKHIDKSDYDDGKSDFHRMLEEKIKENARDKESVYQRPDNRDN